MSRPDGVLVPETLKCGHKSADRIAMILSLVEPILGVDRSKGEKGWIRHLEPPYPDGTPQFPANRNGSPARVIMITRDQDAGRDTLLFHRTHSQAGDHRYTWGPITAQGVSVGTLVAQAVADNAAESPAPVPTPVAVQPVAATPVAPVTPVGGVPSAAPTA